MERTLAFAVLVTFLSGVTTAQDVIPCLTTKAECTSSQGWSGGLTIINNNYFCCVGGYSMDWGLNSQCTCRRTHEVVSCQSGVHACRQASSFTSDGQGNTRCCLAGYSMQSFSGFINGQLLDNCHCSRYLGGGGNVFSNGISVVNGQSDPNFNASEFGQRMRDWGQRFSQSMANSMQAMQNGLSQSLSNMFRGFSGK